MYNSKNDISKLISNLDITPNMYYVATNQYKKVAEELLVQGINVDFFPQGSFRLGTVIRPFIKGENKKFDLDIIGNACLKKDETEPGTLKKGFGEVLRKSQTFGNRLLPEDMRCWTLDYENENFQLDIVPSAQETDTYIDILVQRGILRRFAEHSVAITNKDSGSMYSWCNSNPEGYARWFEEINEPFLQVSREQHRVEIFNRNKEFFASIEEIPPLLDRSALQRVIQILKRHRDVYFTEASINDDEIWEMRPLSIVITTLCAQIARNCSPTNDVLELLQIIARELSSHAALQDSDDSIVFENTRQQTFIRKKFGKWSIKNPVNPDDDYTEFWTSDHAKWFFRWLRAVYEDFFVELDTDERRHYSALKKAFGAKYVENIFPETKVVHRRIIESATKPYGVLNE